MALTHGQCLAHRERRQLEEGPAKGVHCPDCWGERRAKAPLNVDLTTKMFDPKTGRFSVVRAAFCTNCEFVIQF